MLEVVNLGVRFPDKKLFENVNIKFNKGNTYGIIGANGAGKSTFLKIIGGQMDSTSGNVLVDSKKRISILGQNRSAYDEEPVVETVIGGNKQLVKILEEKNAIYVNPDATEKDYEHAAKLEEEYGQLGGWSAENDAAIILDGLGISKESQLKKVGELKSSEKVKVLLARALFGDPDILILDEPTNHLDLKAIKWLENFLANYEQLVIVVSHDNDFLDQVCTHIVDIDFGGAKLFTGNYSFWKQSSELAKEMQQKQNAKKEEQIKRLQDFVARFSANASKSSQATSRKKSLEKITIDEIVPSTRKYPFINFELNREPGKDILIVDNLSYINEEGEVLFENISFHLTVKDKIAVIGPDDLSKSKFFDILLGKEKPTTGTVKWGTTITPDYLPQNIESFFEKDEEIIEWISEVPLDNKEDKNKDNSTHRMRSFLGRMLFANDSVFKKVKTCSGGEKMRLFYARMMLRESNFLLFDQPLNHLDTESIDSFISSIQKYKSAAMFSTYNRGLIKEAATAIIKIDGKDSFVFKGSLENYEAKMGF